MKTITIEHPLRPMYYWDERPRARLEESEFFIALTDEEKTTLVTMLDTDFRDNVFKHHLNFMGSLNRSLEKVNLDFDENQKSALAKTMLLTAFGPGYVSENPDGSLVPDPDLREVHSIPDDMDIQEYMEREVLPKDELAWVAD